MRLVPVNACGRHPEGAAEVVARALHNRVIAASLVMARMANILQIRQRCGHSFVSDMSQPLTAHAPVSNASPFLRRTKTWATSPCGQHCLGPRDPAQSDIQ